MVAVKQIQVRCALCVEGTCNFLGRIEKVRETVASLARLANHRIRSVRWILQRVVRADCDNRDATLDVLAPKSRNFFADVFHERTVVTEKKDEQRFAMRVVQRHAKSARV